MGEEDKYMKMKSETTDKSPLIFKKPYSLLYIVITFLQCFYPIHAITTLTAWMLYKIRIPYSATVGSERTPLAIK